MGTVSSLKGRTHTGDLIWAATDPREHWKFWVLPGAWNVGEAWWWRTGLRGTALESGLDPELSSGPQVCLIPGFQLGPKSHWPRSLVLGLGEGGVMRLSLASLTSLADQCPPEQGRASHLETLSLCSDQCVLHPRLPEGIWHALDI